ncbi:hypothetical protein APF79_11980 [bacterium BRH_c32]|nr:MAG: hypothetical protein APF79_11980 [bacterium BRH_c32]
MKKTTTTIVKKVTLVSLYSQIRQILDTARSSSYKAVNFLMVQSYWQIGKLIVEEEQNGSNRAKYGEELIKQLAERLKKDFGKGFTETNLKYFRQFYNTFPISHALSDKSKIQKSHAPSDETAIQKSDSAMQIFTSGELSPQLSWTHYRTLLKVTNKEARAFYIKECIENNWSTRELERQIASLYYERLLSSRNKKLVIKNAQKDSQISLPMDIIKDPYVLEFLEVKENTTWFEKDLEQALINKLQHFLLELGKGFSFVSRQKRITVDGDHFYIDLVFYNYILKCFVLIDLKIGKLTHQDIGQMDFYVRYYEKEISTKADNPTIGLILCSDKNDTMVKYTLLEGNKNVFASKYMLYLPTENELAEELERERELIETEIKLEKKSQ